MVCSTWELPVLCAPLQGLHTLETGVRCAVGDAASPLGAVVVVGCTSRTELPDGTIGNIWVYAGGAASPKTRGIASLPLQWLFNPSTKVRSGPYHPTGETRSLAPHPCPVAHIRSAASTCGSSACLRRWSVHCRLQLVCHQPALACARAPKTQG